MNISDKNAKRWSRWHPSSPETKKRRTWWHLSSRSKVTIPLSIASQAQSLRSWPAIRDSWQLEEWRRLIEMRRRDRSNLEVGNCGCCNDTSCDIYQRLKRDLEYEEEHRRFIGMRSAAVREACDRGCDSSLIQAIELSRDLDELKITAKEAHGCGSDGWRRWFDGAVTG